MIDTKMVYDEVLEVRKDIAALKDNVAADRVAIEHRMTKVEGRAGFFGALSGLIGGALAVLIGHRT